MVPGGDHVLDVLPTRLARPRPARRVDLRGRDPFARRGAGAPGHHPVHGRRPGLGRRRVRGARGARDPAPRRDGRRGGPVRPLVRRGSGLLAHPRELPHRSPPAPVRNTLRELRASPPRGDHPRRVAPVEGVPDRTLRQVAPRRPLDPRARLQPGRPTRLGAPPGAPVGPRVRRVLLHRGEGPDAGPDARPGVARRLRRGRIVR